MGKPSFRTKTEQEQDEAISHLDEQAAEAHGKFMQLVFDLIDGTHDSSTYEDACRSLLGEPYPDAPSLQSAAVSISAVLMLRCNACLHAAAPAQQPPTLEHSIGVTPMLSWLRPFGVAIACSSEHQHHRGRRSWGVPHDGARCAVQAPTRTPCSRWTS